MEYNSLEYVRKFLRLYYVTYNDTLPKKDVDALCLSVSKIVWNKLIDEIKKDNIINDDKKIREEAIKRLKNGKMDDEIILQINTYVYKINKDYKASYFVMRSHIDKYINDHFFVNYSIYTLKMITDGICAGLIHKYDYKKLSAGEFDGEIQSGYDRVESNLKDAIRTYVNNYISNNIVLLTDINYMEVGEIVVDMVFESSNINSFDLLMGRCDSKINEIAIKNREENRIKRLSEMPDTVEYIKHVAEIYTEDIQLVNRIASKVDMDLRKERFLPSEIVSGKYDRKIRQMFNEEYHKNRFPLIGKSIEGEDVPSKIPVVSGKKNINKIIAELLVASALLGALSYGGYMIGKEIRNDKSMDNLKTFDPHNYSGVSSIYVPTFKDTALNIIETFDDYRKFNNDNYTYLGFYRAFNGVSSQKLYVMDNMMEEIRNEIYMKEEHSDLMNILRSDGCYLDFLYDRLYDMGYTEIRDMKYSDLLNTYMRVKKEHRYKDPVEYLSSSQQRLLNKVISKYEELSQQHLIEFGVLLGEQDIVLEASSSVRRS